MAISPILKKISSSSRIDSHGVIKKPPKMVLSIKSHHKKLREQLNYFTSRAFDYSILDDKEIKLMVKLHDLNNPKQRIFEYGKYLRYYSLCKILRNHAEQKN